MYYLIHQQGGNQNQNSNLQFLRQIADDCFHHNYKIIITDSSISKVIHSPDLVYVPCDNKFREFSGWKAGILHLQQIGEIGNISGILFSNETLLKHRPIDNAIKLAITKSIKYSQSKLEPLLTGDVNLIRAQGPYHYSSIDSFYISTYFCFINKAAIQFLNVFIPDDEIFDVLNSSSNNRSVVLENMRSRAPYHYQFIEEWLYQERSGPKWYAHERLSQKNYKKMYLKFLSIIIEHGISQKFVMSGGRLIDYKKNIKRGFFENCFFFLKRIRYTLGWRTYRLTRLIHK